MQELYVADFVLLHQKISAISNILHADFHARNQLASLDTEQWSASLATCLFHYVLFRSQFFYVYKKQKDFFSSSYPQMTFWGCFLLKEIVTYIEWLEILLIYKSQITGLEIIY